MEKKEKNKQNRPLKLSSAGRLQLRKNLGPNRGSKGKGDEKGKTIQIVFRKKNNQKQNVSTAKSTLRGSSMAKPQFAINTPTPNRFTSKTNRNFNQKNKKNVDLKKPQQSKKTTLKPYNESKDKAGKLNINKVLEQEAQEYDKFPSLAKRKRALEKEKLKLVKTESNKISREIILPEIITVK